MEEKKDLKQIPAASEAAQENTFKGYTLEDIHYQRALVMLQREFAKEKIAADIHKIKKRGPFGVTGKDASSLTKAGTVVSKLINGFNYMDYALVGFSAFSTIRKVFRFFKKKK